MKTLNFGIDQEDLKVLYIKVKSAYNNIPFNDFVGECKIVYKEYTKNKENPKTYSQWVNGQIIALN